MSLDAQTIKENLTMEDVIKIVTKLGSDYPKHTNDEDVIIFNTVCHNKRDGSYKLYYMDSRKLFTCFTQCGESMDIYELIKRNKALYDIQMSFYETVEFVANLTGMHFRKRRKGFGSGGFIVDDWNFINGYNVRNTQEVNYKPLPIGLLDCFDAIYHQSWIDDGISIEVMKENNIKYNTLEHQIVIPHYHGITNDLIGIRCRNLVEETVERGNKYMPVYLQGVDFAHSLSGNLYGLNRNRETIKRLRKAMIVESEKAVMQCETMYGESSNFTVATCSSNVTNMHRDLLLDCGIDEVILGFDKDFSIDSMDYKRKMKSICRLAKKFISYVRVYVLEDMNDLLELNDSPTDKGKEVLEELMKNKVGLTMDMIDEILEEEC